MKLHHPLVTAGLLIGSINVASAAAVSLEDWVSAGDGVWNVEGDNNAVNQTKNGLPTFFYEPDTFSQGLALSGKITVTTTFDDDFIGFALGIDSDDFFSETANFILIDWKQSDQSPGVDGLAISHVTDSTSMNVDITGDFWDHMGGVTEIQRGATLGSTGWEDNTEYSFDLQFTPDAIQVSVDGSLELSITPANVPGLDSFEDGAFAFYNHSQGNVRYSALEEDVAVIIPTPAIPEVSSYGTLLALGLLSLTVRSRRS